jgi:hypothetical protein
MEKGLESLIVEQAEYYMSDENLKKDSFFHSKISESKDGFIPIDFLLNCNKMKKHLISKEELAKALKNSTQLVVSDDGNMFKRVNSKIPTLTLLNKKRYNNKTEEKEETTKLVSTDKNEDDVVIYSIKSSKCVDTNWRIIQESIIKNNPGLEVSYMRFAKDTGHLGIANKHVSKLAETKVNLELENGNNVTVEIYKCTADDLVDFWKLHGNHLKMCLNKDLKFNKNSKQEKEQKKNKKKEEENLNLKKFDHKLTTPVSLGQNKFIDIKDIRQKARSIMNNIKEGDKPLPHETKFLEDVLKYHPNKQKTEGLDYFTTGQHPDHPENKCFFIIKKGGEKNDFSINKCLEVVYEKYSK